MSFVHRIDELVAEQGSALVGKADHWERVPLSHVARVVNGFPFASNGFNVKTGKPVIRIRDVTSGEAGTLFDGDVRAAPKVEHGELVIGMDGDFNSRLWPGDTAWLNQRVCKIEPIAQYYSKSFLAYAIPAYLKLVNDNTSAITVKHLSSATVQELPLPLPPRAEQDRVASKIDELFSRIDEGEAALARVEKLVERYRQSVLKAAVTGELTRDWREARKRAGESVDSGEALLARILKARRAAWEAAELAKLTARGKPPTDDRWKQKYQEPASPDTTDLPELPEGWVWARLASLVAPDGLITDGDWVESKDQDPDGAVRLVQLADVGDGFFRDKSARFLTSEKAAQLDCTYLAPGDVLISRLGVPLGKTCLFPKLDQACVTVVDVHIFRSGWPELSHQWMMYALNSSLLRGAITAATSGTTRQRITGQKLNDMPVPIPPPMEQLHAVSRIQEMLSRIDEVQGISRTQANGSQALRQSILKAAFSGQLVPQDPHDEPASKLLERIAAERASMTDRRHRKGTRRTVNHG